MEKRVAFLATRPVNQMSITFFLLEVGSSIKIILVTKYVIKSIRATDPVTKFFYFIKSNIGDPTLEILLKNEANVDG